MSFIALVPLRYAGPYSFVNILMRRSLKLRVFLYLSAFRKLLNVLGDFQIDPCDLFLEFLNRHTKDA